MNLSACDLCPRHCGADRLNDQKGFCGMPDTVMLSRAALHFYEEPCISGKEGSGAVFFTGCGLRCVYCQNFSISRGKGGFPVTIPELAEIFLDLQAQGANNMNLVTPTHYGVAIRRALRLARKKGLTVPAVYNTSGYETVEAIRYLQDDVDVYLTDFKYCTPALAKAFSGAEDYPEKAKAALREMVRVLEKRGGDLNRFDERGMMKQGIVVRHLLLPGHVNESKAVLKYLHETYGDRIYYSIMNQYTPVREIPAHPELNRRVTKREYERLLDYALELGIRNAFIQDGKTQETSFIPAFDGTGVRGREGVHENKPQNAEKGRFPAF